MEAGKAKALAFVEGRTVAELTELSEEVVDTSMLDRVWPGTRALVQMHLDAGQQVWLVTATPVMLARVIATRLGLSGALGTVAEEVDGVYTGRLVGDILHGPGKAHAIATLAEAEGFDLSRCYAYSDSFNDMPMLTMVGHPVAINPDSKLRKYASENGWDVKDFRTVRKAARRRCRASSPSAVSPESGRPCRGTGRARTATDRARRVLSDASRLAKKTLPRRARFRNSVFWMVSRTWSVISKTTIGSSAASAPGGRSRWARRTPSSTWWAADAAHRPGAGRWA